MSFNNESNVPGVRDRQRGQVLVLVAVCFIGLISMVALIIDLGTLYAAYTQLNVATQAAAIAGGQALPSATSTGAVTTVVDKYSAVAGGYNTHPYLTNVQMVSGYPKYPCLTTLANDGVECLSGTGANAVIVTEQATVSTFFANLFGVKSVTISATAAASAPGGFSTYKPYNVMVILDTTASMADPDNECTVSGVSGTPSAEQCAQAGIQSLLHNLGPCSWTLSSCGTITNDNVPYPLDQVGLMVFPGLCSQTAGSNGKCPLYSGGSTTNPTAPGPTAIDDTTCTGVNPVIAGYNDNPIYLVYPLASDYRSSDAAKTLNTSSGIVIAVNGNGSKTCPGVGDKGGVGTFYAGAITAATNYLTSTTTNPRANTVPNIMILVSDGDATSTGSSSNSASQQPPNGDDMWGTAGSNGTVYTGPSGVTNDCGLAVEAATTAKKAGILIYSVSYGSETSGCDTDSPKTTPCATMSAIASTPVTTYFFSVPKGGTSGGTVCSPARSDSTLNTVFQAIAGDLTVAHLIPLNTT
jgi:hypothetical protein